MFTDKIPENTRKILEILAPSLPPATYLAGGTALSLHLNHRSSFDIDLYSRKMFNEITQIQRLKQTIPSFEVVSTEWQTIQGKSKVQRIHPQNISRPGIYKRLKKPANPEKNNTKEITTNRIHKRLHRHRPHAPRKRINQRNTFL
jgi:hypothetical protein